MLDVWRLEDCHGQLHFSPIGITSVLGDRHIATPDRLSIHYAVTRMKWATGRAKSGVWRRLMCWCPCRQCRDRRLRGWELTEEDV